MPAMSDPVGLSELKIPLNRLAPLEKFRTRDGGELQYRRYPCWSRHLLILYHGVGGDSRYWAPLASRLAELGWAQVVTPDLRGHGVPTSSGRAPEVKSAQLEEDFDELLIHLKFQHAVDEVLLGGHSLGGGLALKILCSSYAAGVRTGLLFAPLLPEGENAAPGYGGWISREGESVKVHMPPAYLMGNEILEYPESFIRSALPAVDWAAAWEKRHASHPGMKLHVFMGLQDQVLSAGRTAPCFRSRGGVSYEELPASHLGVVLPGAVLPSLRGLQDRGELFR
ncbi:MAG: alpha/beta fold hydrolase [Bdellovibrionaceae bacterium]|nr:alpha/beta fold hydrolase [Pseudobdellovibrionaceae bacterium]